jgi:hypothetical protein
MLTTGLGWALIVPANIELGPWASVVSSAWLAVLAAPVGFYATRLSRAGIGAERNVRFRSRFLLVPLAALAIGIALVPALSGIAGSPWHEWAGAMFGAGAAGGLARLTSP